MFPNMQRCPFRRSLASYGLAAWLVSVFFDRRHSRWLRASSLQFSVAEYKDRA